MINGYFYVTNLNIDTNTYNAGGGCGIFLNSSILAYITNCTIANNQINNDGASEGAGLYVHDGPTVYLKNTILANNIESGGTGNDFYIHTSGTINDNGYNIVEYSSGYDFSNGTGNLTGNQASLNLSAEPALINSANGTKILYTTAGSVAIDAGDNTANGAVAIPVTDQRGTARNGTTDIGAYEYYVSDTPLPIELINFMAKRQGETILLKWQTESETENLGFILERKAEGENIWTCLANYSNETALQGHGSTTDSHVYEFIDENIIPGLNYAYRLADVAYDGTVTWHEIIQVTAETGFKKAYPNPFNPMINLEYGISEDADVTLQVYNTRGELVETLFNTFQSKGTYEINWNPKNVSGGLYFVRLHANDKIMVQKILYVK